jgi:hypothetical protein
MMSTILLILGWFVLYLIGFSFMTFLLFGMVSGGDLTTLTRNDKIGMTITCLFCPVTLPLLFGLILAGFVYRAFTSCEDPWSVEAERLYDKYILEKFQQSNKKEESNP